MSRSQPDIDPGQATLRRKASFASKCPGFTSNAAAPGATQTVFNDSSSSSSSPEK